MDKLYSGHYPFVDEGPLKLCRSWFDVVSVEDKTEDYRLTGVRDRKHFQAIEVRLTPRKIAYIAGLLLLDPFVLNGLLYYTQDSWMCFYGDNSYRSEYDAEYRQSVSFVKLLWITLQLKFALPAQTEDEHAAQAGGYLARPDVQAGASLAGKDSSDAS